MKKTAKKRKRLDEAGARKLAMEAFRAQREAGYRAVVLRGAGEIEARGKRKS